MSNDRADSRKSKDSARPKGWAGPGEVASTAGGATEEALAAAGLTGWR